MEGSEEALGPQGPRPKSPQVEGWSQKREALKRNGRGPGSVRAQRNCRPGCMAGASQDPQEGKDV